MVSTLKSLLLGPAKSGKTGRVLEMFSAAQSKRTAMAPLQTILIVPSRADIERVKSRLAAQGLAFFSAGIVTFQGLARVILSARQASTSILNDAERVWLLRKILLRMQAGQRLRFLNGLADNRGFLRDLAGFVKELKHAEIFYPKLKEALRRKGPEPKDEEILEIYKRYQNELVQKNVYDEQGLLWHAKAQLDQGNFPESIQTALVDGFDSFTPTELAFLRSFACVARSVTVTLTLEKDPARPSLFAVTQKTRECLQQLLPFREEWLPSDEHPATLPYARPNVTLYSASDITAEARHCARQIKRSLSENPGALGAIAVCARNLQTYKNELIRALDQEGLPHQLGANRALAGTPLFCFLLAFMDAHASPTLSNILRVLSSQLVAQALQAKGIPDSDWLARVLQEGNITHLAGDWKTRLQWVLRQRLPRHPKEWEALPEQLEGIATAFARWPKTQAVSQHMQSLHKLLKDWAITPEAFRMQHPALAEEWNAAWGMLNDYAAATRRWQSADDLISLMELRDEIAAFSETATVRRSSASRGIAVLEAEQFRGASFDTVFVLGVNEGVFPFTGQRHTLYSVQERRKMIEAGLEIADEGDVEAQERLLWYQVLGAAKIALFISYARSTPSKKECLPSAYFRELCDAQGVDWDKVAKDAPWPGNDAASWTCRNDALAAWSQNVFTPKSRRAAVFYEIEKKWNRDNPEEIQGLKRRSVVERLRERGRKFSPWDAQIQDPSLRQEISAQFGMESTTSASRLHEYAACPFRFYARYVFGMDPQASPYGELSAMLHGTLIHDILWRLYHAHFQSSPSPTAREAFDAIKRDLPATAKHVFQTLELQYGILRPGVWEWEKNRILSRLKDFLDHDELAWTHNPNRLPAYFELAFGMPPGKKDQDPSSVPEPLVLTNAGERLRIRGKIDRVDLERFAGKDGTTRTGFWVLDYKSGASACSKQDIRKGKEVQLPIYVLAARQVLSKLGANAFAAGASLYSTWPPRDQNNFHKNKKSLAAGNADDEWEEILEDAQSHLFDDARGISAGRFTPTPMEMKCVPGCRYRSACRFDERRIENKCGSAGPAAEDDAP